MTTNPTTWSAVADELGVSRRHLTTWRRDPTAPKGRDIEAWRAWVTARQSAGEASAELRALKLRRERALTARAELDLERERGGLVTRTDAKAAAALVRDAFLREGGALPSDVARRLGEQVPASVRTLVEQAVVAAWIALRERVAAA